MLKGHLKAVNHGHLTSSKVSSLPCSSSKPRATVPSQPSVPVSQRKQDGAFQLGLIALFGCVTAQFFGFFAYGLGFALQTLDLGSFITTCRTAFAR